MTTAAHPARAAVVRVLVLNAGSSTLKASVVEVAAAGEAGAGGPPRRPTRSAGQPPPPLAAVAIDWGDDASRGADTGAGVSAVVDELARRGIDRAGLAAVAHRVVHGGAAYREPRLADETVIAAIESLAPFAPLHNPVAAATIRAARALLPGHPHVAVFDTAFHATLPEAAWRYPLPAAWDGWGIRRYGFHGLSVAWSAERAAALLGRQASDLALVVAHLGSGCSVTAVAGGRSVATSMGMTPLEGLMMGTRAGSVDPGILLAVLRDGRLTTAQLADDLDHRAGLLGVSGQSAGMLELGTAAEAGDARAALAIEMFVQRAAAGIAGAASALPRLDALVFTAGIGEHAGGVRARIVEHLAVLGCPTVGTDEPGVDRVMARAPGGPAILRIEAREDLVAGRAAAAVIASSPGALSGGAP